MLCQFSREGEQLRRLVEVMVEFFPKSSTNFLSQKVTVRIAPPHGKEGCLAEAPSLLEIDDVLSAAILPQ